MMKAYDRILETFQKFDTSRIKQVGRLENRDFTRDRKMPFNDIIRYILSQKGKTTTIEINNYFKEINEIINLKINKSRLKKINYKDIKAKAKQIGNINVRMIRITLSTGEDEYLATNIPYDEMDTNEIGLLYFKRWGIEASYDVIKNKLCIENISGNKENYSRARFPCSNVTV